ncbi:MAG TPA: protein kinase [Burkholderiales bacterium]|nr:protein kinase [Burkholderiales bacterium]
MTQENTLARYTILRELGRGSLGVVWAARDGETGALVALKPLGPALSSKVRAARRLKHPNIVEILDAGEMGGAPYVAMEMLEGESLRKILDREPPGIARAIEIVQQVAAGLAYAHLEGVVHGSIKPSNIIVLRSGLVKINDFGIGQPAAGEPLDHRSDIFSLGALFYELLARRPAFKGGPAKQPPPPSEVNPLVPRALDEIVLRMLAPQPANRMAGVPVLLQELERIQEGLGMHPAPNAAKVPAEELQPREASADHEAIEIMERERWEEHPSGWRPVIFAAVVLALIGSGIAGFMYYSSRAEPEIAKAPVQPAPAPVVERPKESVVAAAAPQILPAPPPPAPAPAPVAEPVKEPVIAAAPTPVAAKTPPSQQQRGGTAQLVLAVSPRGEVYIDGKHHGTTPPTTTLHLEPGMHRIEVRSGSRSPYVTYMTVQAGDVRRIRHDFNAKHIRPPA